MTRASQRHAIIPALSPVEGPETNTLTRLKNGETVRRLRPLPVQDYPHKIMCPYCHQIQVLQHGWCFACQGEMLL
jgi:hypothetical protein